MLVPKPNDNNMIVRYFTHFISGLDVSEKQKQSYGQTAHWLAQFEKETKYNLNFRSVDKAFYNTFWTYFVEGKGYAPNTFGKHIKQIKSFMRWGQEENLHRNKAWKKFKITNKVCEEPALNSNEMRAIYELDLEFEDVVSFIEEKDKTRLDWKQKQGRFRNLHKHFHCVVALYSSGMYPNDLLKFDKSMIIDDRYVKYKRFKSVNSFKEPWCIFPYADDDLFHFKSSCEEMNFTFSFEIAKLYRDMKVILGLAGINKKITARSFRKSFASTWYYERGLSIQNVMKMTGHSRESSLKHYLNIDDDIIINKIMEKKPMVKVKSKIRNNDNAAAI